MRRIHFASPSLLLGTSILLAACGSGSPGDNPLGIDGGNPNGDGTVSDSRPFQFDGSPIDGSTETSPLLDGAACVGSSKSVELTPLDMVVLVDTSGSMDYAGGDGGTVGKWLQVSAALKGFAQNPKYANMGMGLQFFPSRLQCNVESYATPAVPIGKLSEIQPAIQAAIDEQRMSGGTPIVQVLQGMLSYSRTWSAAHTNHKTVVVLATDGIPDDTCTSSQQVPINSLENAVQLAMQSVAGQPLLGDPAAGDAAATVDAGPSGDATVADAPSVDARLDASAREASVVDGADGDTATDETPFVGLPLGPLPRLPVFVIGVGSELTALHSIAQAGGTDRAIIISGSGNVAEQFIQALDDIRRVSLTCDYPIPPPPVGQTIDPDLVNVSFRAGGVTETFSAVDDQVQDGSTEANCAAAPTSGWHYDNPKSPKKIVLCPQTCSRVQALNDAEVSVFFGCKRQSILR